MRVLLGVYVLALVRCAEPGEPDPTGSRKPNDPEYLTGDVRLVDGSHASNGRVEIFKNGEWGTVCNAREDFTHSSAEVVCRQLGYDASHVLMSNPGNGTIHLKYLDCQGKENNLLECLTSIRSADCGHSKDLTISCSKPGEPDPTESKKPYDPKDPITGAKPGEPDPTESKRPKNPKDAIDINGDVQVVAGHKADAGVVVAYNNGRWGIVCKKDRYSLDLSVPKVVCRQLGYETENPKLLPWKDTIEVIEYGAQYLQVKCNGNEYNLQECNICNRSQSGCSYLAIDCGASFRELTRGDVRLVDGSHASNGRVEIFKNGEWGTVCNAREDFTKSSAEVVCRQLGYDASKILKSNPGTGKTIHLKNVRCQGRESNLLECSTSFRSADCKHANDLTINCYKTSA